MEIKAMRKEDAAGAQSWQELNDRGFKAGGWMTYPEREELFRLALLMKPGQRMVEIGVFGGTTLSVFALMTEGVEVIGIDPFTNDTPCSDWFNLDGPKLTVQQCCHQQLALNGVTDKVRLIEESSQVIGHGWKLPIDLLIVDGDHSYGGALQDLNNFAKWVTVGGALIVDDVHGMPDVANATRDWLNAEPAGRWKLEWGAEKRIEQPAGLVSKMFVFRRQQ